MENFKERLENYRHDCGLNKTQMAKKLGIKANLYSMLSTGDRSPSEEVLNKLEELTNKNGAYWIYGIDIDMEKYIQEKEAFKNIKEITQTLLNANILDLNNPINEETQPIFLKALTADILTLIEKQKIEKAK